MKKIIIAVLSIAGIAALAGANGVIFDPYTRVSSPHPLRVACAAAQQEPGLCVDVVIGTTMVLSSATAASIPFDPSMLKSAVGVLTVDESSSTLIWTLK